MIRAEPVQPAKSPVPVPGTICPNQLAGSDSSPPCCTVTDPSRPSSVRPVIRDQRHPGPPLSSAGEEPQPVRLNKFLYRTSGGACSVTPTTPACLRPVG